MVFLFRISLTQTSAFYKGYFCSTYLYAVENIFRRTALGNTVEVGGKWERLVHWQEQKHQHQQEQELEHGRQQEQEQKQELPVEAEDEVVCVLPAPSLVICLFSHPKHRSNQAVGQKWSNKKRAKISRDGFPTDE